MYVYSYIHLNPAKLKNKEWKIQPNEFISNLESFINEYPYSSLQEYISGKYSMINPEPFPIEKDQICNFNSMIDDYSEAFLPKGPV